MMDSVSDMAAWSVLHASCQRVARYGNIDEPIKADCTNIVVIGNYNTFRVSRAVANAIDDGTRRYSLPNLPVAAQTIKRADRFDIALLIGHGEGAVTEKFTRLCAHGQLEPGADVFALYCVSLNDDAVRCHSDIACRDPVPLDGFEPVPLLDEQWSINQCGFFDTDASCECVDAATRVRWRLTRYRHVPEPPATVTPWTPVVADDDYYKYYYNN